MDIRSTFKMLISEALKLLIDAILKPKDTPTKKFKDSHETDEETKPEIPKAPLVAAPAAPIKKNISDSSLSIKKPNIKEQKTLDVALKEAIEKRRKFFEK